MKTQDIKTMKTRSLALLTLMTLFLLGCEDREPEIEYNHGFAVEASNEKETLSVQEGSILTLTINPNRTVTNTEYTVTYDVTAGEGTIQTLNENTLAESTPHAMSLDTANTQQFRFVPQSEGEITLAIRIADNHGGSQEFNVVYTVEDVPFSLQITPRNETIFEATTTDIVLNLTEQETTGMEYQMKINTPIPADIIASITDATATELIVGEWYPIALGESILKLTALQSGTYSLSITIKDTLDQETTEILPLTIATVPFTASFAETEINISEGQTKTVTLSITQEPVANITYRAKLNTTSAIAAFSLSDNTPIVPEVWFDVVSGENTLQLSALTKGSYTADFSVMASNEVTEMVNLPIAVSAVPVVSMITSGITFVDNDFKTYINFDHVIDTSNGAETDPKRVEIKFISGSEERIVEVDFATAPRHATRAGYIQFDAGNVTNNDDLIRLGFYERRNSSYEVKISTSNDEESAWTPATNRFRDYDFEEN